MIMSVSLLLVSHFPRPQSEQGAERIGLTADGRILIDKARVECQSHRLTVEDPVSIEYITKHVAGIQQVSYFSFVSSMNQLIK